MEPGFSWDLISQLARRELISPPRLSHFLLNFLHSLNFQHAIKILKADCRYFLPKIPWGSVNIVTNLICLKFWTPTISRGFWPNYFLPISTK